jgi:hypothetical protein
MATLIEQAALASGEPQQVNAADLGRFIDRVPFRHPRFPSWFGAVGGATHPRAAHKGLEGYIHKLRRGGHRFPWRVRRISGQLLQDLEAALTAGHPTLIYGVGTTGVPHVVVPIKREVGGWLVLDPGYARERNPMHWSDAQLEKWWTNYSFVYPRGTMISLMPALLTAPDPKAIKAK